MATDLLDLSNALLRVAGYSATTSVRVRELLMRSGDVDAAARWHKLGPEARIALLEKLRTGDREAFIELVAIATMSLPPSTPQPQNVAGAAGRVEHLARTSDHVDFRAGTFQAPVVGVQHNHYGGVAAPAEWRPIDQVGPFAFGVHPTRLVPGLPDVPPYVTRDRDEDLCAQLARPGLVLILGEPYAGKSYTAWHGVRLREDHRLYTPYPGEDLRPLVAALRDDPGIYVIWLDELAEHLGTGGLNLRLLGRLNELGAVVLATMTPSEYYRRRAGTASGDRVVAAARTVVLEREWSESELQRLAADDDPRAYPAYMWSGREGAASYFAVGHLLFDEWQREGTRQAHPRGQLLVRAAVDLARCGVTGAVPAHLIKSVHERYTGEETEKGESFEDAFAWATAPMFGVSGLLVAGDERDTWRAYGALVAEALGSGDLEPVPDEVWWTLLDAAALGEPLDREAVLGAAHAALRSRIEAGDVEATFSLAVRTEGDEGVSLLRRAADAGHGPAAADVAEILLEEGKEQEALPYLEIAAESGDSWAVLHLARMHRSQAERWLRAAAEAGNGAAAHELGDMVVGSGREDEAFHWYLKAVAAGHHQVAGSLGVLLSNWAVPEAEKWLRYGMEWGDVRAANSLGVFLSNVKHDDEAETEPVFRQAAEGGNPSAAVNLGLELEDLGREEEALTWYRKGHERGAAYAELRIAELLMKEGKNEEAADWFRRAAAVDPQGIPESFPPPPGRAHAPEPDTVKE
ncbi:tetratricopeptide repeat protein [Streptomyces sp. NK08204]|uniref:tetratricopeptide repeat protein n=1 Tax=Streptomyces sp. NK08204 TaxID=2873260 RepID=UPI001CED68C8|nr:tetratricopeptide repeat protein [Streptomyces sp. NK08204]